MVEKFVDDPLYLKRLRLDEEGRIYDGESMVKQCSLSGPTKFGDLETLVEINRNPPPTPSTPKKNSKKRKKPQPVRAKHKSSVKRQTRAESRPSLGQ